MVSTRRRTHRFGTPAMLLASVTVLVAITPFGNDASQPLVFLAYRLLLVAVIVGCYSALEGVRSPDLPPSAYALGIGILGLMGLSVWNTPGNNPAGWTIWSEHLLFGLFFVCYARYSARQSTDWRMRSLLWLVGVTLAHLVLQLFVGSRPDLGLFPNPNYLAAYLLVGFASALALTIGETPRHWRIIAGGSAAFLFYGIAASLSRGATLAAIGVLLLAVVLHQGRRAAVGFGIVSLVGTVAIVGLNPDLLSKFADRGAIDPYNYQRLEIWKSTADLIADHPILGVGPGQYEHVARRYRFPVEGTIGRFMKRASIAHSEYLHYAAEAGIPAALLIFGLLGSILWRLLRGAVSDSTRPRPGPEYAGLLALSGICVHALVDNVFQVSVVLGAMAVVGLAGEPLTEPRGFPSPTSTSGRAALASVAAVLVLGSTLLPGIAYELNATGRQYEKAADFDRALLAFRTAVALRPNDGQLLTDLGLAYRGQYLATGDTGLLDTADAYLARAAAANPSLLAPRQAYADSLVLRLSGNASDGWIHLRLIEANRSILELDPFLPLVRQNLAEALYRSGRVEEAIREVERTLSLEPNFVPGYRRLAEWYEQKGDPRSRRLEAHAEAILRKYAGNAVLTPYEATLLGRTEPSR